MGFIHFVTSIDLAGVNWKGQLEFTTRKGFYYKKYICWNEREKNKAGH